MSDFEVIDAAELQRQRSIQKAQVRALQLFLKQWNACGPNSDFGRYFSNVRVAAEEALKDMKS